MSAERRLDRLYEGLSAKERGVLVLRAYKAREQPDDLIYDTTPSEQRRGLNHYIRLMNALNTELATALMIIREQVAKLDVQHAWLMTVLIWGLEVQILGDEVLAASKDRKLRRDVRAIMARAPGNVRAPVDLAPQPEPDPFTAGYGDELVRGLLFGISGMLQQHWAELRAIAIYVNEVAEEFGEDPLQPEIREMLDGCLSSCTELRESAAKFTEIELAEPDEETLGQVRLLVEQAAAPVRTR